MKSLESGKDKIQKICDALRKETLEPAKQEAKEVVENAHLQAAEIIREAKAKADKLLADHSTEMAQRKKAFESSLELACRQGIEALKQKIERGILFQELDQLIAKETSDPQFLSSLINSFLQVLEEKGIEEDLSVTIPKSISPRSINSLLVGRFLEKLKGQSVVVGEEAGGIQIQLIDRKITIELTDRSIKELIADYIRRDFRELVFQV